jgi:8-oxo-dGTP pyrophosphatase MutT (NUDIX family)
MHRRWLLTRLERHETSDVREVEAQRRMIDFVREHEDCFSRSLSIGHITGSAWLIDPTGRRALLTFHRKLDKWLQLGGHADGQTNVLEAALRECREESGIERIEPVHDDIFDVDIHRIPKRGDIPAHLHFDVRFLVRAPTSTDYRVSDESHDLKWVTPDELTTMHVDESVRRLGRKWLAWLAAR